MRFQATLSTYPHDPQRKKKEQKERNGYYYSFNLLNPEGTDHVLLKGDILTSYEHKFVIPAKAGIQFNLLSPRFRRADRAVPSD